MKIVSFYHGQMSFGLIGQLDKVIVLDNLVTLNLKDVFLSHEWADEVALGLAGNGGALVDLLFPKSFDSIITLSENNDDPVVHKFVLDHESAVTNGVSVGCAVDVYTALNSALTDDRAAVKKLYDSNLSVEKLGLSVYGNFNEGKAHQWQTISLESSTTVISTMRKKARANALSFGERLRSQCTLE